MKRVNFKKYHGIGNDFILIDLLESEFINMPLLNDPTYIKHLCNRRLGIGADGVIFILPPKNKGIAYMKIVNSDGSIPEMCGNGIRCLIKYLHEYRELSTKSPFIIETLAGNIESLITETKDIKVNMGTPIFDKNLIPTTLEANYKNIPYGQVMIEESLLNIYAVSMGNPHMVLYLETLSNLPISKWGALLEKDYRFPNKTNVHFVNIEDGKNICIKVWERGAGITEACGTGACAVLAVSSLLNLCEEKVKAKLPGGELIIHWPNNEGDIFMTGPAKFVFAGHFSI